LKIIELFGNRFSYFLDLLFCSFDSSFCLRLSSPNEGLKLGNMARSSLLIQKSFDRFFSNDDFKGKQRNIINSIRYFFKFRSLLFRLNFISYYLKKYDSITIDIKSNPKKRIIDWLWQRISMSQIRL
jgi:hypothetical protein